MFNYRKRYLIIIALLFNSVIFGQHLSFELFKTLQLNDESLPIALEDSAYLCGATAIGDLDRDGVNDLIISGPGLGHTTRGELVVAFMNADGTFKSSQFIGEGKGGFSGLIHKQAAFGLSVDTLGDLDRDGNMDIIVGAPQDDNGFGLYSGAVYILFLNTDGTVKDEVKISQNNSILDVTQGDKFGMEVSTAGDLDGDGNIDVFVSSFEAQDVGVNMGVIYILYLNSNGTVKSYKKILPTFEDFPDITFPNAGFGDGLANVGDIDGNGMTDIVAGTKEDRFWIILLNTDGTVKSSKRIDNSHPVVGGLSVSGSFFGRILRSLPDLNFDGVNELLVTACKGFSPDNYGESYVFFLDSSGDVSSYESINRNTVSGLDYLPQQQFGNMIYHIGDINSDGYPEIAVGESARSDSAYLGGAIHFITLKPRKCIDNECVWPGDANNDGKVNSSDYINIGAGIGISDGIRRILPLTSWTDQTCDDWENKHYGVDLKYADTDGDGNIDFDDVLPVRQNYSQVSFKVNKTVPTNPLGPPLYILPNTYTVSSSDSIVYHIYLGDSEQPAENVYGLSMKWQHNVEEVFGSDNSSNFNGSWLGTKNVDMIADGFPLEDGIDIGMARTDQVNRTGQGYLATGIIVIPDNLGEIVKDFDIRLTDLIIVSYEGDTILPNLIIGDPVVITTREEININLLEKGLKVYPNPSSGVFNIDSKLQLDKIRIVDLSGRVIHQLIAPSQKEALNLSSFDKGAYVIEFQSGNLIAYERVFVK
jgi:hypothetical protein